jgi:tetratricopeptide (TPR) repeat protein
VRLTRLLLATDPPAEVRAYMAGIVSERRRAESLRAIAHVFLSEGHPEHALAVLDEARALSPDDAAVRLTMADALIRLGDLPGARAQIAAIPEASGSFHLACGKRVLIGLVAGDAQTVDGAVADLAGIADGLYAAVYAAAFAAQDAGAPTPTLPAGIDSSAALDVLLELAGTLLDLDELERFNALVPLIYAVAPEPGEADQRLGYLLYVNDFPDPAADRLMAAIDAGVATPDAYAALGRICQAKDLDEEAEAFMRVALESDEQNMSRHLDLAGLLAGAGRYADADAVLREGQMVYPHSSVLRELRQSLSLLAAST